MKNKKIADMLLIILPVIFIIVQIIKINTHDSYYIRLLTFVVEAAMVGGIADWFAITALFRKPLGFPFHTAIIPRNRDKVIEAVANVVENELLSKETLQSKIKEVELMTPIIAFVDNNLKDNLNFEAGIIKIVSNFINEENKKKLVYFVEGELKNRIEQEDLSVYLVKTLNYVITNHECFEAVNSAIDKLVIYIEKDTTKSEIKTILEGLIHKNIDKMGTFKKFFAKIGLGIAQGTESVNLDEAAYSIQQELSEYLIRIKNPDDYIHMQIVDKIEDTIKRLDTDKELINTIDSWKINAVKAAPVYEETDKIIDNILKESNIINSWIIEQIDNYWEGFKSNEKAKAFVERYVKNFIFKLIKSRHSYVGNIVKRVLDNMTDEKLNNFIEEKAGNDLHWIRINGCMIGAAFGLIVFLFMNEIYMPVLNYFFHLK